MQVGITCLSLARVDDDRPVRGELKILEVSPGDVTSEALSASESLLIVREKR